MEKIITQCSNCQTKFKLDGEKLGKKIRCPKCKGVFVVAELGGTPKAAPKPAAPKPQVAPAPSVAKAPAAPPVEEQAPAPAAEKEIVPLKSRPRPLQVKDFFETQHSRFIPEKAEGVHAHISYNITGDGGGEWTLMVDNGKCTVSLGGDPSAKSQVRMTSKTYLKLAQGKLDGRVAFMLGKIKIKGDKSSLPTVRECFQKPEV